jgi:hypothetical protein
MTLTSTPRLRGAPPSASYAWGEAAGNGSAALRLVRHASSAGAHPTLGRYQETRLFWATAAGRPVETAFMVFADGCASRGRVRH